MRGVRVDEVMRDILAGAAYWRPETGELVFYDEVFDEPPEGPGGTFHLAVVDLEKAASGDVWAGYTADGDRCMGRLEAVTMVSSQPGWERVAR